MSKITEDSYIKIAIELAKKGRGLVSPNPLTGVVLVKNDKIIGAGFNSGKGNHSAELEAFKNCQTKPSGAILYSNLESNPGEEAEELVALLKKHNIEKVVYGTTNPHPDIQGNTIKSIKNAGIATKVGLLESDCCELNKIYFKYITKRKPYITLKIAMTLDGKIADHNGDSKWISSVDSRCKVHEHRSYYDAILVGRKTVEMDDPELTVRLVEGNNPKRIVLDSKLKSHPDKKIFDTKIAETVIITSAKTLKAKKKKVAEFEKSGVKVIGVPENKEGKIDLKKAVSKLAKKNVASLYVEGGSAVFSEFVKYKLFDELNIFLSPKLLGEGLSAINNIGISSIRKSMNLKVHNVEMVGTDLMATFLR